MLAAVPARAVDWSLGGTISQRLQAETDPALTGGEGASYDANTRLGLSFGVQTSRSELEINTGVSVALSGGRQGRDDPVSNDPFFDLAYRLRNPRLTLNTAASFDVQPVSSAQAEETGVTANDATQISVRLATDAAYALDGRNDLTMGFSLAVVRFTGDAAGLSETSSQSASIGWRHALTPRHTANLTLGLNRFASDDAQASRSLGSNVSAGLSYQATPRLSFDGNLGVRVNRTSSDTVGGVRASETSAGLTASGSMNWLISPDTTLGLSFSQGLEPSSLGELQNTTRLSVNASHAINNRLSLGVGASYLRQRSGGGFEANGVERDLYSFSPTLSYEIAPRWQFSAGSTLRLELEQGDEAVSALFFLSLTRGFTLLRR